jgi:hypothetical protein
LQKIQSFEPELEQTESPNEFYVTRMSDLKYLEKIDDILKNGMNGFEDQFRLPAVAPDERQPGALCIVARKSRFLRGRIEAVEGDKALVINTKIFYNIFQSLFFLNVHSFITGLHN